MVAFANLLAAPFERLPFPLLGNLILFGVSVLVLVAAVFGRKQLGLSLVLAFAAIQILSRWVVEFDHGGGDGFGMLFAMLFTGFIVIHAAAMAGLVELISRRRAHTHS